MRRALVAAALVALVSAGCRQDMHDQPKVRAQSGSAFFPDGHAALTRVEKIDLQIHQKDRGACHRLRNPSLDARVR